MSIERVKKYFEENNIPNRILEFSSSSATVALAAEALGTEPCRIAKTMSFWVADKPIVIVLAGDVKVSNKKFKQFFGAKAKMISFDEVEAAVGHAPGGVCPFALKEGIKVYLDESIKRFETVFPAAGSANSAVEMTPSELMKYTNAEGYISVSEQIVEQQ